MARPAKTAPGIGERLVEARGDMDRKEFADALGVHVNTIANYERGDRKIDPDFLVKLREEAGVDVNWLLTGEGGSSAADLVVSHKGKSISVARYSVQASAGGGAVVLAQDAEDYFTVGRDWLERYVPRGARTGIIEARGDSMEPTIRDGDILLLNFEIGRQDVANGGVFVITIDGQLFVKRLQIMLDGSIKIFSDNGHYEPETVDREYADEKMQVHARVVWAGGPLR